MNSFKKQLGKVTRTIQDDHYRKFRYIEAAHRNYQKSVNTRIAFSSRDAKYLHANNEFARLNLAKLVFASFETLMAELEGSSVMQITLTPAQGSVAEADARSFDPLPLKRLVTRYFKSVNMLGIIEPGFYPRYSDGTRKGLVSFHVHAIGWGTSPVAVRKLALPFKQKHPSHFPHRPSAYVQTIPVDDVPRVLAYQLKPPEVGYDVAIKVKERVDPATGEIVPWLSEASNTWKRKLRTGERIRIDNCLSGLTFDKLLVATGDGVAMKEAICREALADYRRSAR